MTLDRAPGAALRELASRFSPGQSVAAQAKAVARLVRRYAATRWQREVDQHRAAMLQARVGIPSEWLFTAFAASSGSVPSGRTQMLQILSSNCCDEAIPAGGILISPVAVPGMVEADHQEPRAMAEPASAEVGAVRSPADPTIRWRGHEGQLWVEPRGPSWFRERPALGANPAFRAHGASYRVGW